MAAAEQAMELTDASRGAGADCTTVTVFQHIPSEQQVRLVFENISSWATLPGSDDTGMLGKLGLGKQKEASAVQAPKKKQVLFDVSGDVSPGEVLALMGPSGSGKTTLLSVLASRAPRQMRVTGNLTANGAPLTKAVRRRVGYVTQDDLLHANLTVYETLLYTARLRMPKTATIAEKIERTNAIIAELGLDKARNTIIGGPFAKGVSGGERKRVSIGQELLLNPAVLFLDEPTSGLDSTSAMYLIATLNTVAQAGRGVMTTIHQPSSRLYQGLQKLMLLANGHTMYYGKADQVIPYFERYGLSLPVGVSTPEFIMDVASGDKALGGLSKEDHIKQLWTAYNTERAQGKKGGDDSKFVQVSIQMADADAAHDDHDAASSDPDTQAVTELPASDNAVVEHTGASYPEQLVVLLTRDLRNRRGDSLAWQNLFQYAAIAVLGGIFWLQRGLDMNRKDAESTAALLYFELMMVTWSTLFVALFTFPSEFQLLLKERGSGLYQLSAYYWAHSISDIPMDCLYPSVFAIIIYFMTGLRLEAWAFFANWAALLLMVLTGQSIGLFLGSAIMNARTLMSTAIIMVGSFMVVGGYFVRNLPDWIDWVKYLSLFYYGYNILLKIQFSDRTYYDNHQPINISKSLNLPSDVNDSTGMDIGLLFAICIGFRVATFLMLRHRTGGL